MSRNSLLREIAVLKAGARKTVINALPFGIVQFCRGRFSKAKSIRDLFRYERVLRRVKRKSDVEIEFLGVKIIVPDFASFFSAFREIFTYEALKFQASSDTPVIIDLGSNIGVSIAYFKSCYPHAEVYAVEADPKIFDYLKRNLERLDFHDIRMTNMAAWNADTEIEFLPDGADGGKIEPASPGMKTIRIKAFDFEHYLEAFKRIDFLKMDVEGAEAELLIACERHLHKIERLFVEYHSEPGKKQDLDRIISILARNGFRINIRTEHCKPFPFISQETVAQYDNQLDIYAFRADPN
jgi:FkbM family methyltransferase